MVLTYAALANNPLVTLRGVAMDMMASCLMHTLRPRDGSKPEGWSEHNKFLAHYFVGVYHTRNATLVCPVHQVASLLYGIVHGAIDLFVRLTG